MRTPRKAIVLCAGFGTRMSPLSHTTPKPLMPLWGKPLIQHILEMLHGLGVRDVLMNLHHAPAPLLRYLTTECNVPLRMTFSLEPTILGTGGALRKAEWFLDSEPFWIVNSDIAMDVSPRPFLTAFKRSRPLAALWVTASSGPRTLEVTRDRVRTFNSSRAGSPGTYTFCGLHLASPRLMKYVGRKRFSSIIDAYTRALAHEERIAGVCRKDSFWADTGTAENYLDTHRRVLESHRKKRPGRRLMSGRMLRRQSKLRRGGVLTDGFAAVGENVKIAPGARLSNVVIWDNADLGPRADVAGAVVAKATRIRGTVTRMALRADGIPDADVRATLDSAGFEPSATTAEPLAPRGSARSFTRIARGVTRAMLMQYSLERPENGLYVRHARFLHRIGVPVPGIILNRPETGIVLLEDVGGQSLLDSVADAREATIVRYYRLVIDAILPMHRTGPRKVARAALPLSEPFSSRLYAWEHDLFASRFLRGMLSWPPARISTACSALERISKRLLREPEALIHRDLQSTNILLRRGRPVFVDFQGMRIGAAAYDLASLLCDPYVSLPVRHQESLVSYYAEAAGISVPALHEVFWYAAVQRLVQAIGAYARLAGHRETHRFRRHIEPALTMLARALKHVEGPGTLVQLLSEIQHPVSNAQYPMSKSG